MQSKRLQAQFQGTRENTTGMSTEDTCQKISCAGREEGVCAMVPMQECEDAGKKLLDLIWVDTDTSVDSALRFHISELHSAECGRSGLPRRGESSPNRTKVEIFSRSSVAFPCRSVSDGSVGSRTKNEPHRHDMFSICCKIITVLTRYRPIVLE